MSRPLLKETTALELEKLHQQLEAESSEHQAKFVRLPIEQVRQLSNLIKELLVLRPIVFEEEYLTPNQASEMVGVSRPLIIQMLKMNSLEGHQVGSHWKVKKQSLIDYMSRRDKARQSVLAMDEDGFGLD